MVSLICRALIVIWCVGFVQGCSRIGRTRRGSFFTGVSTTTDASLLAARFTTHGLLDEPFPTEATLALQGSSVAASCGNPSAPIVVQPEPLLDPTGGYELVVVDDYEETWDGDQLVAIAQGYPRATLVPKNSTSAANITMELTGYDSASIIDYRVEPSEFVVSFFVSPLYKMAYILYPDTDGTAVAVANLVDENTVSYSHCSGKYNAPHLSPVEQVYDGGNLQLALFLGNGASCTRRDFLRYNETSVWIQHTESIFDPEGKAYIPSISAPPTNEFVYLLTQPFEHAIVNISLDDRQFESKSVERIDIACPDGTVDGFAVERETGRCKTTIREAVEDFPELFCNSVVDGKCETFETVMRPTRIVYVGDSCSDRVMDFRTEVNCTVTAQQMFEVPQTAYIEKRSFLTNDIIEKYDIPTIHFAPNTSTCEYELPSVSFLPANTSLPANETSSPGALTDLQTLPSVSIIAAATNNSLTANETDAPIAIEVTPSLPNSSLTSNETHSVIGTLTPSLPEATSNSSTTNSSPSPAPVDQLATTQSPSISLSLPETIVSSSINSTANVSSIVNSTGISSMNVNSVVNSTDFPSPSSPPTTLAPIPATNTTSLAPVPTTNAAPSLAPVAVAPSPMPVPATTTIVLETRTLPPAASSSQGPTATRGVVASLLLVIVGLGL